MKKYIIIGILITIVVALIATIVVIKNNYNRYIIITDEGTEAKYSHKANKDDEVIIYSNNDLNSRENYLNTLRNSEKWTMAHVAENIISSEEYKEAERNSTIDNISLRVKDETITRTSATFILTNKNKIAVSYGEEYRIERKENEKWIPLNAIHDFIWHAIAISSTKEESELKIDWGNLYGELENGDYRFVKSIKDSDIYAEFTIE